MRTPIDRKIARVLYYLQNVCRDAAPQSIFRRRLPAILDTMNRFDPGYLAWRVNYYNKLAAPAAIPASASTVGTVPMAQSLYYYDLKEHARYFPRFFRIAHQFGDITAVPEFASIVKSRPIGGENCNAVLLNLDKFRHFYFQTDPIPFADKKPMVVWRGGAHTQQRWHLLARHSNHPLFDIGRTSEFPAPGTRKPFLRPIEQMRFRYVLSVQGHDVATNLKWILASNCLCLMSKPTNETWFVEGRLEAGTHYALLRDDFEDLEEKMLHYERHPAEALAIIRNANEHAAQFLNGPREQLISLLVLYKYFVMTGQLEPEHHVTATSIFSW